MARKKNKLDFAAAKLARIVKSHLENLSPVEARAMREEIHALTVRPSRSAN
jgi:hypothetical protein